MSQWDNGCSVQDATPAAAAVSPPPAPRWPGEELRRAAATAQTWSDWLQQAGQLTSVSLAAIGVFAWEPASSQQSERLDGLCFPATGLADEALNRLRELAQRVHSGGQIVVGPLNSASGPQVAGITLRRQDSSVVLLVLVNNPASLSTAAAVWLPLVAACSQLWSLQQDEGRVGRVSILPQESMVKLALAPAGTSVQRPKTWKRSRWIVPAVLVACGAMAIPVPYDVTCDCELQPVTRRFVAAPFEGALERAFVEVGDTVSAGDVLVQMDGKEIRWELAGNVAEYEQAAKERDAHLADQKFGEAQLAKLQMERVRLTTKLLEHRGENLDIRSPIDGIVVTGELKRAEGIRLSMGQNLFEIAPLDRMIVEVEISESELAHVPANTSATIRLEAFPDRRLEGQLQRICPRAELRGKQQVFVGEIALPNDDGRLRPGMRGRVALQAGRATLGWRLFHRAFNKLLLWWGA